MYETSTFYVSRFQQSFSICRVSAIIFPIFLYFKRKKKSVFVINSLSFSLSLRLMIPIAPAQHNYSPAQTVDIQKEKRRRSKRSCDFCRQKKTRCDGGLKQPCTKCRQSQVDCVYLTKQKKRGPTKGSYVEMLEKRLKRMETLVQHMSGNKIMPEETAEEDEEDEVASQGNKFIISIYMSYSKCLFFSFLF